MKVILTESQIKKIISAINEDESDEYSKIYNTLSQKFKDLYNANSNTSSNSSDVQNSQTETSATTTTTSTTSNTKDVSTNTTQTFSGNKCHLDMINTEKSDKHTLSKLYVNGQYVCDVLEDAIREKKIKHETCIPAGTYRIELTKGSKFSKQSFYKKADGGLIPWVKNVPGFSGIMIHCGTNVSHTSGCLLLGTSKGPNTMKLVNSQDAWKKLLLNYLCPAWEKKIPIDITVKR